MTFLELREKYKNISYDKFTFNETENSYDVAYYYTLGEYHFVHKLSILKREFFKIENLKDKDVFLFNIGLCELISYYKAVCPKKVILKAGALKEEQIDFWKTLFYNGLGEFRFLNKIDVAYEDFVEFENATDSIFSKSKIGNVEGNLIPVGGGKDSIVTLELLREDKEKNTCFIINPRGATNDTVNVAGYDLEQTVIVKRKIDPLLLNMNQEGFLNGHTPFSASLAFISLFCALLSGKQYIVLSNESSANESTDEETGANHQYSKSLAFELNFVDYVERYVNPFIKYFSLLRGMREIDIAKLFAEHKQYHSIFRSCNRGSVGGKNDWCGKCPKCLFVYIMLAPFLTKEELKNIFGADLLDDMELEKYYRELTGLDKTKPFECVGTRDEVKEAVKMIAKRYCDDMPALIKKYPEIFEGEQHLC